MARLLFSIACIIALFVLIVLGIIFWVGAIDMAIKGDEWKYYGNYEDYGFDSYEKNATRRQDGGNRDNGKHNESRYED